jgi:hypothetical protein
VEEKVMEWVLVIVLGVLICIAVREEMRRD